MRDTCINGLIKIQAGCGASHLRRRSPKLRTIACPRCSLSAAVGPFSSFSEAEDSPEAEEEAEEAVVGETPLIASASLLPPPVAVTGVLELSADVVVFVVVRGPSC